MTYQMYGSCNYIPVPPPIQCGATNVRLEQDVVNSVFDPVVWGEGTWLFLHAGSLAAPEHISEQDARRYWGFIEGLPLMLPCVKCGVHAQAFVDAHRAQWKTICAGRASLIEFFVSFHNYVNRRSGKPEMTPEDVYRMSDGNVRVCKVKYL